MPRKYEKVQELLPEVKRLKESGYTYRQIAEKFRLSDGEVVRELLKRERKRPHRVSPRGVVVSPPRHCRNTSAKISG